jgi:adenosylhomocysteine nucleosidase
MLRGLRGPDVRVVVTGMGAGTAERHAEAAIADGAVAAISTGFCGALDPALGLGDVVVPERVLDAATGEAFTCDASLTAGVGHRHGTLVTTPGVVSDRAARAALAGVAVDMESAGIARACARAGVPFAAVRAVTDRAGDVLPHFDGLVDEDGRVHGMAMARRLVAHPSEIAAWTRLARGANAARRGLVPAVTAMLADAA